MWNRLLAAVAAVFGASLVALAAHAATDVNKASRAELEAVPGVGPSLSERILEARKTGEFRNWNDLVDRVVGIGPRSADRLSQAGLTVSGASYKPAGDAAKQAPANKAGKPVDNKDSKATKPSSTAAPATASR